MEERSTNKKNLLKLLLAPSIVLNLDFYLCKYK